MKRLFYEQLLKWKTNDIETPLMVVGARQIGKTYIINEFCKNEFEDYIYVNLMERQDLVELFESNDSFEIKMSKFELLIDKSIKENTIVFFDEIQESESLISMLKAICESSFPYKIICAGSLLGVKLNRFNKSFPVGKVIIKHMYPMNFKEFLLNVTNENIINEIINCYTNNVPMEKHLHEKLLNYYRMYLVTGGMPKSILNLIEEDLKILNINEDILNSIISSYIADMKRYVYNVFEAAKIERIYKSIPQQLGKENKKFQYSIISKNARKRDYETSIDWLFASNLVVPVYFVSECQSPLKASQNLDIFKLYLNDVGILVRMLEMSKNKIMLDEDFRFKGAIAENFVINELKSNGLSLYYWSKNQVAEVDVIIESEEGPIPIEVKAGENKRSKSLNYYIEKNKPHISYRISTNNFGLENNIKSIPIYATFCISK